MGYKLIKIYLYSIVLFILGLIISLSSYLSVSVFADNSAVDNFTLSLPVSCTIGSNGNTHTQSVNNNQYYPNLGGSSTTFTVYCNDAGGYVIYAIGSSDNTEGNTNLVGDTSATAGNRNIIPTGVYPLKESEDGPIISSWSVKLATSDSSLTIKSGWDNVFHVIPSNWTDVVRKESGTVDSTTGSTVTATYDAYIDGTQAAGTYTGQVKYVMFHPSTHPQPININESFANNGKTKIQATDPLTGESGEFYAMQDMNTTICSETNVFGAASEAVLADTRDSKLYYVTKLKDGHCWMTENLDLDLETTPNKIATLTSENTDLNLYGSMGYDSSNGYSCSNPNTTTNCTASSEVITWTPERATIPEGSLNSTTWQNDNNNPYSYDNGLVAPNGVMDGHGYTGNYYNWTAAVASNASGNIGDGNAVNSICPKGWRLPNTRTYEFSKMLYAYGVTKDDKNTSGYATGGYNKIVASPLYFVRSGNVNGGSLNYSANSGYYWSSAVDSTSYAFYLDFHSDNVRPAINYYRYYGFSVRCLAE